MQLIESYLGVGPVRFGMDEQRLVSALGGPQYVTQNVLGERVLYYESMNVALSDAGVVEVSLLPSARVMLEGVDVFSERNIISRLRKHDPSPKECFGFVVFLGLGVALAGFHDGRDDQKAISAFAKGRWDRFSSDMIDLIEGGE